MRPVSFAVICAAACATLAACGSGSPPAVSPGRAPAPAGDDRRPPQDRSATRSEALAAPRPLCEDGTCFRCGDGYCPAGFYCDESAPGGPACGWIPACNDSRCACLSKALSPCRCEQASGGAKIRCDQSPSRD